MHHLTEVLEYWGSWPPLAPVLDRLEQHRDALTGAGVYLVGGAVRDLILGQTPTDVDLAVDGDAAAVARALAGPVAPTRFGTITVSIDGLRVDLARTRRESYAHPGALPDVAPATIDIDLARRDFTVNAIALGLAGSRKGELLAADGALADLDARRLAVLHDRSFEDDPTRLLRLARYAARLHFEIAPHTAALARRAVQADALGTISPARLGNELRLLAHEPDPVAAFEQVGQLGLGFTLDASLARAALAELPPDGRPDILVLALVLADANADAERLDALEFTAHDRDAILEAATQPPLIAERLKQVRSDSEVARILSQVGAETVALAAGRGDPSQPRLWLDHLRHMTLQITGDDLLSAGVPQGPAVGRALAAARDSMYDGKAPDREAQLAIALKAAAR